jgi:hypothetical protein
MKDYPFALFIVMLVVVVWSIYMAKNLLEKLEKKETQPLDSSENVNTEKYEIKGGGGEAIIIPKKVSDTYKEVLKKDNCSSTTKPTNRTHLNDKQNLTKYNHGTYRDKKGRFQSNKKWKKEQNHS